jgi:preflagellin peptidase FlaK
MNELLLDFVRVILCLSFLVYASVSDFRKREVSNKVWLVMAPSGFALTIVQFMLFSPDLLPLYALSFGLTTGLSVALFYGGAFGGADAKALMCLALVLPIYPADLFRGFQSNASSLPLGFPITVFTNGVLLAAFMVVYSAVRNCFWRLRTGRSLFEGFGNEPTWRKVMAFLTGYKIKVSELEKGHMYPLEDLVTVEGGESKRHLLVMPKDEKTEGIMERISGAARKGRLQNEVWATPGLPLLIFITAGLIIALLFGNLVWIFMRFILA